MFNSWGSSGESRDFHGDGLGNVYLSMRGVMFTIPRSKEKVVVGLAFIHGNAKEF